MSTEPSLQKPAASGDGAGEEEEFCVAILRGVLESCVAILPLRFCKKNDPPPVQRQRCWFLKIRWKIGSITTFSVVACVFEDPLFPAQVSAAGLGTRSRSRYYLLTLTAQKARFLTAFKAFKPLPKLLKLLEVPKLSMRKE